MPNPAFTTLTSVGVLLRDDRHDLPLAEIREIFQRHQVRVSVLNFERTPEDLQLVVALGGDGTVLRALDEYPGHPVLAINFGTVGFLTAGDRADLEKLLERLLAGEYLVSERLILACQYPGGTAHAVNEAVIRTATRMIHIDVVVGDTKIRTIRGDGVIIGTPTGSTGYLLSTGSPVVMPQVNCFILDGINEYNFSSRALVLSPDLSVRLQVSQASPDQEVRLIVDGKVMRMLQSGDEVVITRSPRRAQLIFFDPQAFFHNLTSRLSWK